MPRKRTVDKARIEYSLFHVSALRTGYGWFPGGFGDPHDPDVRKTMKAAWPVLRAQVMEADMRHWGACSFHRAWAWWKFDVGLEERLDRDEQKKFLIEHPALLTPEEKAALT